MVKATILVVEDAAAVRDLVVRYLHREGFETLVACDGEDALQLAAQADLVILDLMLPKLDGLEVCRRLRATTPVPIIMVTARGRHRDKLLGLGMGADDYMVKPFSASELVARVKAVLRRASLRIEPEEVIRFGDLSIDTHSRLVHCAGEARVLTEREFDLLSFLARHPGQEFTREQLLERVWGYLDPGGVGAVTVYIRRLREKIERDPVRPRYLKTVWGVGYRLEP